MDTLEWLMVLLAIILIGLPVLAIIACCMPYFTGQPMIHYADGTIIGYVSAIEKGLVFDTVYIKPTMDSTQEDSFWVSENIYTELEVLATSGKRAKFTFARYMLGNEMVNNYLILE